MRRLIFLSLFFLVGTVQTATAHYFRLIFPYPGAVLEEGKTYTIRWETDLCDDICITALTGGHEHGPLDDCHISARSGRFLWHIPRHFISGFGIKRDDNAWLAFSIPINQQQLDFYRSSYFTIVSPGSDHHVRPYPIRFPPAPPIQPPYRYNRHHSQTQRHHHNYNNELPQEFFNIILNRIMNQER